MSETVYIYGLTDPRTGDLRYVGKTVKTLARRLSAHKAAARAGVHRPCARWIRSLLLAGKEPAIFLIEVAPSSDWAARECFWIGHYRGAGCRLLNLTDGGDHYEQPTEVRQKIARLAKARLSDPAYRAKMKAAHNTPAYLAAAKQRTAALWQDPDYRAKIEDKARGRKVVAPRRGWRLTPETRAKISAARIGKPDPTRGVSRPHVKTTNIEYVATSPDGQSHQVSSLPQFCVRHGLTASEMRLVARGKAIQHKGWTCRHAADPDWQPKDRQSRAGDYIVTTPGGEEIRVKGYWAFCAERGINASMFCRVLNGKQAHHKGWKIRRAGE